MREHTITYLRSLLLDAFDTMTAALVKSTGNAEQYTNGPILFIALLQHGDCICATATFSGFLECRSAMFI